MSILAETLITWPHVAMAAVFGATLVGVTWVISKI